MSETLVFDCGSGKLKAGFAGEDAPRAHRWSAVSPKEPSNFPSATSDGAVYPIRRGILTDTRAYEILFEDLGVDASPTILPLPTQTVNSSTRVSLLEILFEKFNVPSVYLGDHGLLSLYASGRVTGVALECGHGVTNVLPYVGGARISEASVLLDIGGQDISESLIRLNSASLGDLEPRSHKALVLATNVKEYNVALTPTRTGTSFTTNGIEDEDIVDCELPDGTSLKISKSSLQTAPECLFDPSIAGLQCRGLHVAISDSMKLLASHPNAEGQLADLKSSLLVSGGTTFLKGFTDRLDAELKAQPLCGDVTIVATVDRKYSAFIGGAIIGTLDPFPSMCVDRKEYDEVGAKGAVQKFACRGQTSS